MEENNSATGSLEVQKFRQYLMEFKLRRIWRLVSSQQLPFDTKFLNKSVEMFVDVILNIWKIDFFGNNMIIRYETFSGFFVHLIL